MDLYPSSLVTLGYQWSVTHAGGQHAGGCLVKVEGPHAPHAVGDQGQHVAGGRGRQYVY